ncbi:hypothetical protein BCR39DRAFT_515436 [Naematelia encephala]|uniref:F-box domain-containing protein n=1 Tax=Naematelia encephala TaxID=71784 RepID=A0A1Y2BJD0_9TREE|nr:hypothetical protein BCR39DRAFT_515436 [Naematelia encephala]
MSLKRPRSPSPTPSSSSHRPTPTLEPQQHASSSGQSPKRDTHTISDLFPYQEIFLRILSFLSPTDLTVLQGVNKYWAKMSLDPQLWKRLYLSRYPHPHQSRLIYKTQKTAPSISSTPQISLRPIARLPSRAFPPPSSSRSPSLAGPSSSPLHGKTVSSRRVDGTGKAVVMDGRPEDVPEVGYGVRNDGVDWKMMLRLGTNWSNGNALSSTSIPLPPSPSPSLISAPVAIADRPDRPPPYSEQHIALFPSFIFTSNPNSPLVHVHRSSTSQEHMINGAPSTLGIIPPPPGWSSPHRPDNVTAICADQSVVFPEDEGSLDAANAKLALPARLIVFYQSGGFVLLRVRLVADPVGGHRMSWVRESIHPPQHRPNSIRRRATHYTPLNGDPVVLASMHYPVLLTCTLAFHLSVYTLAPPTGEQPTKPKHLSTLHSDVSFHPAALSLLPVATNDTNESNQYRAALTYCTPLYPASWTVAVQEFGVDLDQQQSSGDVWRGDCWNVGVSGKEDSDDRLVWPRKVRPIVGVRGDRAVGVGMDGRWCVLAGEDNQIEVYSLPTPSPSPPPSTPAKPASIVHSQTLLAHSAAVTSISLSSGRCVSGGKDGRVLVWELDEDEEEEDGRMGRTVGYVEVKPGGRREIWRGAAGPLPPENYNDNDNDNDIEGIALPHPASISNAARSLFLPRPPRLGPPTPTEDRQQDGIRQLAFDEEKIVGLIRTEKREGIIRAGGSDKTPVDEIMKVWSFNG